MVRRRQSVVRDAEVVTPRSSNPEPERIRLVRYFFALPEPLSLPDGHQAVMYVGDRDGSESRDDDPLVSVIFHQVDAAAGRADAAMDALRQTIDRAEGTPRSTKKWSSPKTPTPWTVVEAVTQWESPDEIPDEDVNRPTHWSPRADPFSRCLDATRRVVRAYRQATETPYGIPAYVRIPSPTLVFQADGIREAIELDGRPAEVVRPDGTWSGPDVMLLEHTNFPDPLRGRDFSADVEVRFVHWLGEQERGNPLNLWRERFIEARRAHDVLGEEGQAIVLANTSCEVMLDTILALLLWEEGVTVEDAVPVFEEGKTLRRVSKELAPRLGGNWSTEDGIVADWYRSAYRLRHRIVHGGYAPTARQASEAIEAAAGLQRSVMDRIAARRITYKRSALMTLAEEGLRRRELWSGQIKRFFEEVGPTEPPWRASFTDYHRALVAALSP